jgi:hypothetical protein
MADHGTRRRQGVTGLGDRGGRAGERLGLIAGVGDGAGGGLGVRGEPASPVQVTGLGGGGQPGGPAAGRRRAGGVITGRVSNRVLWKLRAGAPRGRTCPSAMGRVAGLASKAGSSGRFPAQLGGAGLCLAGSAGARVWASAPDMSAVKDRTLLRYDRRPMAVWRGGGRRPRVLRLPLQHAGTADGNVAGGKGTVQRPQAGLETASRSPGSRRDIRSGLGAAAACGSGPAV